MVYRPMHLSKNMRSCPGSACFGTSRAIIGLSGACTPELMEGHTVRLDMGHQGDWAVDPRELAPRLGVSTSILKRMKRQGRVHAQIAPGSGEDAGMTRVTVRLHDKGWRGAFDQSGALITEEMW